MRMILAIGLTSIITLAVASSTGITPELSTELASATPDELISCLVYMKAEYPFTAARKMPVIDRIASFRAVAAESQAPVLTWLKQMPDEAEVRQTFWVMNGFHLLATPRVIEALAGRDDIARLSHDGEVSITVVGDPVPTSLDDIEWNIRKVMADSCWEAGYTGEGIVIGLTDTGVDHTHPALAGKWSGHWYVAPGMPQTPEPYDDHGHGTHCMGTILGSGGIGVAPDAKFAAAKMLNESGSGSTSQCIAGLQFMADIKESVNVRVVSNSWGSDVRTSTAIFPVNQTLLALDILPVFANGNSGPNPATAGTPGNFPVVVGVGATDSRDAVAQFSSRGPAPDQTPWNDPDNWFRSDWNLIKPNISAPGANINSSTPGGGYASWNGTSMACPHIAGAVALVLQKNPSLTPEVLYSVLLDNADQPAGGDTYPNNDYGWGRLNAWRAVQNTSESNLPFVFVESRELSDPPPGGNGNGILEPGETGELTVTLWNVGTDAHYSNGILRTDDRYIAVEVASSDFGSIPHQGRADNSSNPYRITAHPLTPEGHQALFHLDIEARGDSGSYHINSQFNITIGTQPAPYIIWEDDFEYGGGIDSLNNYWEVSENWYLMPFEYHSPEHSIYNRNARGNYYIRLRDGVDITAFAEPKLGFWQKYEFDGLPVRAMAEVSTNNGATWSRVWNYSWANDRKGMPWSEQIIPLSGYRTENTLVRFRMSVTGSSEIQQWFLDDIRLMVDTDNIPPEFTGTTNWSDTCHTGPFPVTSQVTDRSGVDSVHLYYRVNQGNWSRLVMADQGNGIYRAEIPAGRLGDRFDYYLRARDQWPPAPNEGTDPFDAPTAANYSFQIMAPGIEESPAGLSRVYGPVLQPNPAHGLPVIAFGLPREQPVRLEVYDLTGRMVRNLVDRQPTKVGETKLTWNRRDDTGRPVANGVYFVRFETGDYRKLEKLILVD